MKYSILLIYSIFFLSCGTQEKTRSEATDKINEAEQKMERTKMLEAGFLSGTILASEKESGCPFVIVVENEDGNYMLDPINLDASYKVDGEKIWFTFVGLRMMNRCPKANPINIKEIQKRLE